MLRGNQEDNFELKPRKKIKINVVLDRNYDQFGGQAISEVVHVPIYNQKDKKIIEFKDHEQENKRNNTLFSQVKVQTYKHNIIGKKQVKIQFKEKDQENIKTQIKEKKKQLSSSKVKSNGSNNWKKFLQKNQKQETNSIKPKQKNRFVAIDCQFVKCQEQDALARVSIVDQDLNVIYDTYVRPEKKITDYLTHVSGVTYIHIKNSPSFSQVQKEIKKHLYNKIVVGHTIHKDFDVCELTNWKGTRGTVDISKYSSYQESNGRLISLKNLSSKLLGKKIQEKWHSSVEDAQTTLSLFMLNKAVILKECGIIKQK